MLPWLLIYHLQSNESASISPSLEPVQGWKFGENPRIHSRKDSPEQCCENPAVSELELI